MVAEPLRTEGRRRRVIRWGAAVALLAAAVVAVWWFAFRDRPPATLRARLDADLGVMLWDVSPDGSHLLTASFEMPGPGPGSGFYRHRSRVWDAATGKEVPIPGNLLDAVAFTPDGKELVVVTQF